MTVLVPLNDLDAFLSFAAGAVEAVDAAGT